jgi:hypothetical protein
MFRWCLFLGIGFSALIWQLGDPGQVQAQHSRGGGMHQGARPMFNPGFRGTFRPSLRPTSRFGFDQRFRGGMVNQRFRGGMVDPRFRSGMFDPRFRGGMFTPRFPGEMFDPRLIPGF